MRPIFSGATDRKMKSWKPLETSILKPQISVVGAGVHKRILVKSLKKKSLHPVRQEAGFEQTRSVTPTELPFKE